MVAVACFLPGRAKDLLTPPRIPFHNPKLSGADLASSQMCAGAKFLWTVIQQSLKVCDPQCSRYQPYMITHFNTIITNFHDQFQRIRMRPQCCQVSFTHSPPIVQITRSSVKLCLPLSEVHCFYAPKLQCIHMTLNYINTLRTGDADLRFYISTVQDG